MNLGQSKEYKYVNTEFGEPYKPGMLRPDIRRWTIFGLKYIFVGLTKLEHIFNLSVKDHQRALEGKDQLPHALFRCRECDRIRGQRLRYKEKVRVNEGRLKPNPRFKPIKGWDDNG